MNAPQPKPNNQRPAPHLTTVPEEIGDPIPQNAEAERSILGAILLDNSVLNRTIEKVSPEDFFHGHHQQIYRRMISLGETQQAIDLVTLTEQLHRTGELESAGGPGYIAQLMDGVPRVTNIEHYAHIVKEKALLRALIYAADEIQKQARLAGQDDAEAIRNRAMESIASLPRVNGLAGEPRAWREIFHSWEDFESSPPLSFPIEGFLQGDGATMIGGLSGHGKTLILLSIAKALLAGKGTRLWDLFPVTENVVRVIYLIPECAIQPFKHRLRLFGLYDALHPSDGRFLVRTLSKGPAPTLSNPGVLFAAKGAHVILDTAARFSDGDENSAGDNQRGLASDIFAILAAGARSVIAAHHSPKPFARENVMRLENVLRGSGDVGAMLTTAWGVKQIDPDRNIIHIENLKPRDFQPCGPFQIIGRPYITDSGDFQVHKRPGDCGALMDEHEPDRDKGGAPADTRKERERRVSMARDWLSADQQLSITDLQAKFETAGISLSRSAVKNYRREALGTDD